MKKAYFDSAATTRVSDEVVKAMAECLADCYGNPSSTHGYGRSAKSLIEQARKNIAKQLKVSTSEIIFTSGGTEADNFVLNSAVRDLGVKRIITSKIEHHAIGHSAEALVNCFNVKLDYVALDENGSVRLDDLERLLQSSEEKTLVSLMHVNNELGNILDIKKTAHLCKEYNALFHSDTVQSIGHYEVDLSDIPVDFCAVSAHKFHGPKGVGFVFMRKEIGLNSLIFGGGQERGFRAGTESVHNIVGLDVAYTNAYKTLEEDKKYIKSLKAYFIQEIKKAITEVKFNGLSGDLEKSTYTLVNMLLPVSPERALTLLFQLDIKGIACSKGSACQSGSAKGSHVLTEILSDEDMLKPSLRFSFSKYNTKEEIDYAVATLKDFVMAEIPV
ncbi:cysteine desulfurase family protein [Pseudofulvibacter geojedonensis]|uniref:Cysteine desulfurase family protein n=1 Tax=Pseudofulvibacter geojedonensis TaxID=1123758 RepID=A0ABW3HZU0_9FLAO